MSILHFSLLLLSLTFSFGRVALSFVPEPSSFSASPHRSEDDIRMIQWAGRTWRVRPWPGGPGPNLWCDKPDCVWVDGSGALHLTIRHLDGHWYASEISTADFTNFGKHRFYVEGPIDDLDPNVVLGLFLYSNIQDDDVEELDVEFSTWGDATPAADEGWYTTWYQNAIGEQYSFDVSLSGLYTTHVIDWQAASIDFESLHGFYQEPPDSSYIIARWNTTNSNVIPTPGDEMRIHLNLWLMNGAAPEDRQEVEIIIRDLDAPPEIPQNVQAGDGASTHSVPLRWDEVQTASAYAVYRAESDAGPGALLGSTALTQFEDVTAEFDRTYTYWVIATNDQGESLRSATDTGWRAIPLDVAIDLVNGNDVALQWQHQDAACEYQIFREAQPYFDPDVLTPVATLTAPTSSYAFADDVGNPAENHYYLVRAIGCASGNASPSNRTAEFDFALSSGT